jgi:hypothetical protein
MPYSEKRDRYLKENLLAMRLHPIGYQNEPAFKEYIQQTNLPFKSYDVFGKAELDEREAFYRPICEEIWNPDWLEKLS